MPQDEGRIVDRFLRSLERAPGVRVVDADGLVLQVTAPDGRIVEVRVEKEALLANAREVAADSTLHGLAGSDTLDRSFTLFFLHLQTAVTGSSRQPARLRYTAQGVLPDDGRIGMLPA